MRPPVPAGPAGGRGRDGLARPVPDSFGDAAARGSTGSSDFFCLGLATPAEPAYTFPRFVRLSPRPSTTVFCTARGATPPGAWNAPTTATSLGRRE